MEKLIEEVREIFKDNEINIEDVYKVLSNYKSNPLDWKKYAHFDAHKYTRNLVDQGNGKYNMLVLCWGPGMASSIHDHTNSHCFVKTLDGNLTESLYDWPKEDEKDVPLHKKRECTYGVNEVTYMSDEIGLHRMENPSHSDGCVSLHLYIPPFDTCRIFDEETGRDSQSVVTFYTKYACFQGRTSMSGIRIVRDILTQDQVESQFDYSPDTETIGQKIKILTKKKIKNLTPWKLLKKFIPVFKWVPEYKTRDLSSDIIAGLTVAILNIPQAMAYSALANIPPVIGLYTSFLPTLLYVILGTSKHIPLGMFALVALMAGHVEQRLRTDSTMPSDITASDLYEVESVQIITALTFAVGIVLAVMALLQVHFVSAYLSDEVIAGFTAASAIHVVWSQIPICFALDLPERDGIFVLFKVIVDFFENIKDTNSWALVISICCIVFLYVGKNYVNPQVKKFCAIPIPFELIVLVVTTILSNVLEFHDKHGVEVVGKIPTGLPLPRLPKMNRVRDVFVDAITVAIVTYAITFSVAKLFAKKHGYKVDAAQEIRALSICQLVSSFMLCHPSSASLSRSTINEQIGAKSQLSSFISAWVILIIILWVAPLVEQLPMCVLASIILVALKSMLIQVTQLPSLWRTSKYDFMIWLVSFLGTVLWDVSQGLVIAILFSLLTIVIRTQMPKAFSVSQIGETEIFKNSQRFPNSIDSFSATIFRFEAPLLFVNCDVFKAKAQKVRKTNMEKKYFILDARGILDLDKMGLIALKELSGDLSKNDVILLISAANEPFIKICERFNLFEKIPKSRFFESVYDAVIFAEKEVSCDMIKVGPLPAIIDLSPEMSCKL